MADGIFREVHYYLDRDVKLRREKSGKKLR